ncbi:F-box domain-containing protein [Mycena venus]|uniref:F-box domain-containing protein n=1 Tax=Mycena venus TaxID=2733690 RepID=A0A8H6WYL2_9AGAR|nr:F-box domain-containing protein [Mycena venus]
MAPFSVRAIVLEQTERTRQSSKADIERFIVESELKVISLESQITSEPQSTALVELRDRERSTIAALRYLIAPIYSIPIELLVEIFELAIREDSEEVLLYIKDTFLISHVCSDWRRVAHCTPRLWTGHIHVNPGCRDSEQVYAHGLKAWLARSAPLPVSISLSGTGTSRLSPRILEEVLEISPRWRSLRLQSQSPSSLARRIAACNLDSLEELDLGTIYETPSDLDSGSILVFSPAARFRKVSMAIDSDSPHVSMPWAQLTHLALHYRSSIIHDILGQCPNLVSVSIRTPGSPLLPEARRDTPFALNHLQTLSLVFSESAEPFMPFLDCLSAPALQKLCLDFGQVPTEVESEWTEARFTTFQLRSPNINQLELTHSYLTSEDLWAALRHAPRITHLKLVGCDLCFDDTLIDALHYKDGIEPLVPRLHNLVLEKMGKSIFAPDNFVDMIVSRWWTDAQLASYSTPPPVARWTSVKLGETFNLNRPSNERFVRSIEDLRRNGLDIQT